jgi:hypothetical protein
MEVYRAVTQKRRDGVLRLVQPYLIDDLAKLIVDLDIS